MFQLDRVLLIVIEHFWISKLLNYVTWKLQLEKVYPVGQKIMAHFSSQNSIYYSLLHTTFVFQIQYSFYSTLAFIFQLQHSFLFNLDGRFLSSTFVFFKCNVHYLSLTFVFSSVTFVYWSWFIYFHSSMTFVSSLLFVFA